MTDKVLREIRIDPIVPTRSVLISTARGKRPRPPESPPEMDTRPYVAECPFCRGNEHLTPPAIWQSPDGPEWRIRVVENMYPILDDDPLPPLLPLGTQRAIEGYGHHEVIIDHPDHGIAFHQVSTVHLAALFTLYRDRMRSLYAADPRIRYILAFKNFGKAAGGSLPHTHSQLIAMPIVPHNVRDEVDFSSIFHKQHNSCVYCTLIGEAMSFETTSFRRETGEVRQNYETGKYVVERGRQFIAIKPFASRYEWEVHILPLAHQSDYLEATEEDFADLAMVLRRTMARLNAVVGEVQYNYFLHTLPHHETGEFATSYHWHLEICPRTSIPSGFELGSGLLVNSLNPEEAAAKLRDVQLQD